MAWSAVASSKTKNNTGGATAASLVVIMGVTPTAGNLVAVAFSASAPCTITGTNIEWLVLPAIGASSTFTYLAIGRVLASASTTVTITPNVSAAVAAVAEEYTCTSGVWRFDRTAINTSSGTTLTSGTTGTTSAANELLLAAFGHRVSSGTTFSSPTNSFVIQDQDKTAIASTTDRTAALLLGPTTNSVGTFATGVTAANTGAWAGCIVTIQEVSAGGGGLMRNNFMKGGMV